MELLPIDEILARIAAEEPMEVSDELQTFTLKIEEYAPFVCVALHAGQGMHPSLEKAFMLEEAVRNQAQAPHTATFVASLPISIVGRVSLFECNLDLPPEYALLQKYREQAVWHPAPNKHTQERTLLRHNGFYRVLQALVQKLEQKFKACLVYDFQAYTYQHLPTEPPLFDIGASPKLQKKFAKFIAHWYEELAGIEGRNFQAGAAINQRFKGEGYLQQYLLQHFHKTLVLSTHLKKVYSNPDTSQPYPLVIEELTKALKGAIVNNASFFVRKQTSLKITKKSSLLSSEMDSAILKVDEALLKLVKNFEVLAYVNPMNTETEKKRFFASKFKRDPEFRYRPIVINPYELKRQFYQLPVQNISDVSIRQLYIDVINAYADKVDLLSSLGTPRFLYNCLRYFGEPDEHTLNNAYFLLYAPDIRDAEDEEVVPAEEAKHIFMESAKDYNFDFSIRISDQLSAKAEVNSSKKLLLLKKGIVFSKRNLRALVHHEIGVHMVTTMNAREQPLSIFRIGLPVNTQTQEGLAILSEYLSDNLSTIRLKELALRVVAISLMIRGFSFKETFLRLHEEHKMEADKAYYLTTRVYRGGGFTKDYLYLKGFKELLNHFEAGKSLDNLLVGKTNIRYIETINEMVERQLILPPTYKTLPFVTPQKPENPVLNYLVGALQ
ncbi:flavohemoglobin expression-modulating QEGLA motif protein [Eisenibacter elegans]|jgi:uncharacterized protein (TIGR02421 family)|uniref:flavohemoglobin expression-modulating QEGLA motif protein n=1 Tax=Eisenibacter elegans TaxID=997 RepID=UPI00041CA0B5|nr:flavohemoglobin expression-modulating QEGLA motif protein [Eisenibacter elegans]